MPPSSVSCQSMVLPENRSWALPSRSAPPSRVSVRLLRENPLTASLKANVTTGTLDRRGVATSPITTVGATTSRFHDIDTDSARALPTASVMPPGTVIVSS